MKKSVKTNLTAAVLSAVIAVPFTSGLNNAFAAEYTEENSAVIMAEETVKRGDLNGDDVISVVDVLLYRNMFGTEMAFSDEAEINRADANGDGAVTVADMVAVTNQLLGKTETAYDLNDSADESEENEAAKYSHLFYSMPASEDGYLPNGDCFIYYLADKEAEEKINEDIISVFGGEDLLKCSSMDVSVVNGCMHIEFIAEGEYINEYVREKITVAEFNYDLRDGIKTADDFDSFSNDEYFDNDQIIDENYLGNFNEYIDLRSFDWYAQVNE